MSNLPHWRASDSLGIYVREIAAAVSHSPGGVEMSLTVGAIARALAFAVIFGGMFVFRMRRDRNIGVISAADYDRQLPLLVTGMAAFGIVFGIAEVGASEIVFVWTAGVSVAAIIAVWIKVRRRGNPTEPPR